MSGFLLSKSSAVNLTGILRAAGAVLEGLVGARSGVWEGYPSRRERDISPFQEK